MPIFNHLTGQTIYNIIRRDNDANYYFLWPVGLYIMTRAENNEPGLYFGVLNDGISTDITVTNIESLEGRTGYQFPEGTFLNVLKHNDELLKLIGDKILKIRIARFRTNGIEGDNFIVLKGVYAGIEITTTNNKITFYNNDGGHLSINENIQIPHIELYKWEEQ